MLNKVILFIISSTLILQTAFSQDMPHEELSYDCEECHSINSFKDIKFDHSITGTNLEGRHKKAICKDCHNLKDFKKVANDCYSCHTDVHQAKLGNNCESCHSFNGWENFDIQELHFNTNFPISGRHALIDCQSCHKGLPIGDLALNSTRCVECHQNEYLDVSNPDHVNNSFSTECQDCHQMDRWRPALFDNHEIFFPIFSGNHQNQWDDCSSCHTDPSTYQIFNCLNCHEHNQTETDNNHQGFIDYSYNSDACYFCHPTGEAGDFGDHDAQFFPIFSGRHINQWDDCSTCHTNPSSRKEFSCLTCHDHNQTDTDNFHSGMTGYVYNSADCYLCHPTGQPGQFSDHDQLYFPIFSGKHSNKWDNCSICHDTPGQNNQFNCLNCHEHNQEKMDDKHLGEIAGYEYDSDFCYDCHPNGSKE